MMQGKKMLWHPVVLQTHRTVDMVVMQLGSSTQYSLRIPCKLESAKLQEKERDKRGKLYFKQDSPRAQ